MQAYLERRDPTENAFRFYRLDVESDLFGAWCLTRAWGRIGTRGQSRIESYGDRQGAEQALVRFRGAKQRRGYRALPDNA